MEPGLATIVLQRQPILASIILVLALALLLQGCGNSAHAPVYDLRNPSSLTHYKVQKGDTLYAIAWRFNLDYQKLAKANGIRYPYTIFIGQRIRLSETPARRPAKTAPKQSSSSLLSSKNVKSVTKSGQGGSKVPSNGASRVSKAGTAHQKGVQKSLGNKTVTKDRGWLKPVNGKVVSRFASKGKLSKGVDFAAKAGTKVVSSRSGTVVYAGSRLKGYGNLIIIKHDDTYLSAYAHNRKILVKEGDLIKQGQKIAEVGSSGTDSYKLHFQIRKHGKPIDPLKLLKL